MHHSPTLCSASPPHFTPLLDCLCVFQAGGPQPYPRPPPAHIDPPSHCLFALRLEALNRILAHFEGSCSFHNFTNQVGSWREGGRGSKGEQGRTSGGRQQEGLKEGRGRVQAGPREGPRGGGRKGGRRGEGQIKGIDSSLYVYWQRRI